MEEGRLPTEAKWEYAARGGKQSHGYKYSGSNNIENVAWYWGNSQNTDNSIYDGKGTYIVGTKTANKLGIYDMSRNVWEWCSDRYGNYSSNPQDNPTGPTSGSDRVLRIAGWINSASLSRIAYRNHFTPYKNDSSIGFCCIRPLN